VCRLLNIDIFEHACVYLWIAKMKWEEKEKLNKSLVDIEDALKRSKATVRDDRVVSFLQYVQRTGVESRVYVYNIL
jgi:hypothetical protein